MNLFGPFVGRPNRFLENFDALLGCRNEPAPRKRQSKIKKESESAEDEDEVERTASIVSEAIYNNFVQLQVPKSLIWNIGVKQWTTKLPPGRK